MTKPVNGILFIHSLPLTVNASTIFEHINAFERHSQYKVFSVNSYLGFPSFLRKFEFSVIVFHYSLFGMPIYIGDDFLTYVKSCHNSYKIAFLQDEHRYWPERAAFLNKYGIDCIYTLLEEKWFDDTYRKKTNVKQLIYNIPGYVSVEIEEMAQKYYKPDSNRTVDVGYRGRRLPYYMGLGSQEKHYIGSEFKKKAAHLDLIMDIETEEEKRIYGQDWPIFLSNCKAVLGVEAGVSVFDINDNVRPRYAKMVSGNPDYSFPDVSFEEVYNSLLKPYEDRIYYRTISPRHFEAAALRICQILFEGKYSGILKPMKHYIPLKKDFSNFETVIQLFKNRKVRREITENAYIDLIASNKYSYKRFVENFDQILLKQGIKQDISNEVLNIFKKAEKTYQIKIILLEKLIRFKQTPFPGRKLLKRIFKPNLAKSDL
jgi:hypothetical protein